MNGNHLLAYAQAIGPAEALGIATAIMNELLRPDQLARLGVDSFGFSLTLEIEGQDEGVIIDAHVRSEAALERLARALYFGPVGVRIHRNDAMIEVIDGLWEKESKVRILLFARPGNDALFVRVA